MRTLAVRFRKDIPVVDCILRDFIHNFPNVTSLSMHLLGQDDGGSRGRFAGRILRMGETDVWEKVGDKLEQLTLKCDDRVHTEDLEYI